MIRRRFLAAAGLGMLALLLDLPLAEPEPTPVRAMQRSGRAGAAWLYGNARTGCSTSVGLPALAHPGC